MVTGVFVDRASRGGYMVSGVFVDRASRGGGIVIGRSSRLVCRVSQHVNFGDRGQRKEEVET